MQPCKIIKEEIEVDARLAEFGITREDALRIVRAVVVAHNDAVPFDPVTASGLFRYIYGTRAVRETFCAGARSWRVYRVKGIESAYDPASGRKIIYQSVDVAAVEGRDPKAISEKGKAAAQEIADSTLYLFPEMEREWRDAEDDARRYQEAAAWHFCVSINGDDVRAELSLPRAINDKNFAGFIERIFILREGEWGGDMILEDDEGPAEIDEPIVTKKA